MSRYLALVLLALSASVLAAPAEVPQIPSLPDTTTVTRPIFGERSNDKVHSPSTLHKRDYLYPTSTEDCRSSEVPKGYATHPYTHNGQTYSEECLTQLALSVPPENRQSCRTAGDNARGYDEECLFKKAFDENWKFDLEKAKKDELAYRSAHPSAGPSDTWRSYFPSALSDCGVPKEKVVDAGRSGWTPYTVTPEGLIFDSDCALRVLLLAKITVDLETCPARESLVGEVLDLAIAADIIADLAIVNVLGLPIDVAISAAVSLLVALRTGCLIAVILKIIATLGVNAQIAVGPLDLVVDVVASIVALL